MIAFTFTILYLLAGVANTAWFYHDQFKPHPGDTESLILSVYILCLLFWPAFFVKETTLVIKKRFEEKSIKKLKQGNGNEL